MIRVTVSQQDVFDPGGIEPQFLQLWNKHRFGFILESGIQQHDPFG